MTPERETWLAQTAAQLAARIREDGPEDVGRWLKAVAPAPEDWWQLCFVLAAAIPCDVTFQALTAWVGKEGDPVINQRRSILMATAGKASWENRNRKAAAA